MVSSSSSSEAVEAVLGIVAKGNAILAEISRLAEVLVLVYVVVVLERNTCCCRCCCFTTVIVAVVLLLDDSCEISKMESILLTVMMIKLLLNIILIRVKSLENVQFHLLLLTFSFPECPNTIP